MEGEGPAVVLLHGLGASLAVWNENIIPLAEEHTVYAVDLPGHGKSDKPNEIGYDAFSGAHFLAQFMDTLGISTATLVGNSAGGLIAALFALSYPQRVGRLALVDSAGLGRQIAWFLRFSSLPLLGEVLHTPNVHSTKHLIKSLFYRPRPVDEALVRELMQVRNIPAAKRAALEAIRSGVNLWGLQKNTMVLSRLKHYPRPLIIIWGQEDRILPVAHAHRAAKVLSHGNVHVIPRCGHWPQLERPQEFNPLILGFLKEVFNREKETV